MKIRTKLTLFGCMAVIVPLLLVTLLSMNEVLRQSRDLQAAHFQREMAHISERIGTFFEGVKADVRVLSASPDLKAITSDVSTFMRDTPTMVDSESAGGIESILFERFMRFRHSRPYYVDVYFGTVLGGFIYTSKEVLRNYDPRERPWYQKALETPEQATISPAYVGTNGKSMVSVAQVVKGVDGVTIGVQSVDVTLETLTAMITATVFGKQGYLLLIDGDGVVLADPKNTGNVYKQAAGISDPVYEQIRTANARQFSVVSNLKSTEIMKFQLPELGWTLVGVVDSAEVAGPAMAFLKGIAGVAVVMLLLAAIISTYVATRISSPIVSVADNMRQIAEGAGELSAKLDIHTNDEIGDLAKYFNRFLDMLRAQHGDKLRAQKMEAVGQLAAGVAHEVNTPAQFIGDNVRFLGEAFTDIQQLIDAYQVLVEAARSDDSFQVAIADIQAVAARIDLDFLMREIPASISQSADGISRISTIIKAMKEFSHPGSDELQPAPINRAVENTIIVARAEWKYCSELELVLDPKLPEVNCSIGDVNQAVLNIVVNAAHAIEERRQRDGTTELGKIKVQTGLDGDFAFISISDNGGGIPESIREKIFDPFFTTKEVGKGTGQGLAIAYKAIVGKHGGKLDLKVEEGIGTTFNIMLPVSGPAPANEDVDAGSLLHEPATETRRLVSVA